MSIIHFNNVSSSCFSILSAVTWEQKTKIMIYTAINLYFLNETYLFPIYPIVLARIGRPHSRNNLFRVENVENQIPNLLVSNQICWSPCQLCSLIIRVWIKHILPLQLMKAAMPAESYVIHLSSASLFSCDVYRQ